MQRVVIGAYLHVSGRALDAQVTDRRRPRFADADAGA